LLRNFCNSSTCTRALVFPGSLKYTAILIVQTCAA
jgi:hypothetical protein